MSIQIQLRQKPRGVFVIQVERVESGILGGGRNCGTRKITEAKFTFTTPRAQAGASKASTRSSNFETPSAFEMQSTSMAAHRELIGRSVNVNRMTGVSGISFFRTAATSAPFNRGIARSRSIKSGRDVLAFRTASMPSIASHTKSSVYRPSSNIRTDRRMEALSSAINTVFVTSGVDGYSAPDAIQETLYSGLKVVLSIKLCPESLRTKIVRFAGSER
jgi:hypothetical protein